jgi:hypothetical protein
VNSAWKKNDKINQMPLPDYVRIEIACLQIDVRSLLRAQSIEQHQHRNNHAREPNEDESEVPDTEIARSI